MAESMQGLEEKPQMYRSYSKANIGETVTVNGMGAEEAVIKAELYSWIYVTVPVLLQLIFENGET